MQTLLERIGGLVPLKNALDRSGYTGADEVIRALKYQSELVEAAKELLANLEESELDLNDETGEVYDDVKRLSKAIAQAEARP